MRRLCRSLAIPFPRLLLSADLLVARLCGGCISPTLNAISRSTSLMSLKRSMSQPGFHPESPLTTRERSRENSSMRA